MSTGGTDWASAAALDVGGSNTFDLTDTVAGGTQPYWSGWWRYTPASDGILTVDTNATEAGTPSDADTMIYVYSGGPDFTDAVEVGHDDDGGTDLLSRLVVTLTSGAAYHIRVGTFDSDGDTVTRYHLAASFAPRSPAEHPTYSIGGVTTPAGGDRVATAGPVTLLAVTEPTTGYVTDEPFGFVGDPHVWYKLSSPEAGQLTIDTLLSYAMYVGDPDTAWMNLYRSDVGDSPTTISDCSIVATGITAGSYTFDADAGATYLIVVYNFLLPDTVALILRVSDYGETTDWTQPADQAWWRGDDWLGENIPPHPASTVTWQSSGAGFQGNYHLQRGFGLEEPAESQDAVDCLWDHARQGIYGNAGWTVDGTLAGVGPPTCQPITGSPVSSGSSGRVGATYQGEDTDGAGIGVPGTGEFFTYAAVTRFWVTLALGALGPTGGLNPPTAPAGASTEYEADDPLLLGVDAAPDEGTQLTSDITVQWYGATADLDEGGDTEWGPQFQADGGSGFSITTFRGGDGGPESFPAAQPYQLTDFPPAGGDVGWTPVPDDVLADALAAEAAWQALWDLGGDLSAISAYQGGLRWVGLFEELGTDTPPPLATPTLSPPEDLTDIRDDQSAVVRLRVRPPRYRFHLLPVIPDVDPTDVLRLTGRDDAEGASTALRVHSQSKATRVAGNYPG